MESRLALLPLRKRSSLLLQEPSLKKLSSPLPVASRRKKAYRGIALLSTGHRKVAVQTAEPVSFTTRTCINFLPVVVARYVCEILT